MNASFGFEEEQKEDASRSMPRRDDSFDFRERGKKSALNKKIRGVTFTSSFH